VREEEQTNLFEREDIEGKIHPRAARSG
jgi:hypothetical protein